MSAEALILAAILTALAGGVITFLFPVHSRRLAGIINLAVTALSFLLVAAAWFGFRHIVEFSLPGFLYLGLSFQLNALTAFFALLFAGAWVAASIYSLQYMEHEDNQRRFYAFLQLTLAGCLGVVLAADLLTLFLFFEMMTFCSWVLVLHQENRDAMEAGNLYLYLGVIGGLVLLMGVFLLYHAAGSVAFAAIPGAVAQNPRLMIAMGICFLIGFGIKAGMVPLHIWLPKAHPVAPTPASALLSGIMIKTGAYGLLRVFYSILAPAANKGLAGAVFGVVFLWLGLLTMLLGAFLALQQRQAKRTLAYSSVSQIGYIIMGLGAALLPAGKDLYGISGMLFHILNHAVFKTTLFMCVGAIYVYTHTLEYDHLGGLGRKYPGVLVPFAVAALGIAGAPGFNGYASKTFLHHALTDLYHYQPSWWLWLAEKLFVVASALTICYFIKLFVNLFLGEKDWSHLPDRMAPALQIPLWLGAATVATIGLFPHRVVRALIIPAMDVLGFDAGALDYVAHINVWNWHDVWGMAITAAVAGVILLLIYKFKIDSLVFPRWLSVEKMVYRPLARGFMWLCLRPGVNADSMVNRLYHGAGDWSMALFRLVTKVDETTDKAYRSAGDLSLALFGLVTKVDQSADMAYRTMGEFFALVCRAAGFVDKGTNSAYVLLGKGTRQACISLDRLDQDLDALYKGLGLVYTRAASKLDLVERKASGPLPKKRPAPDWLKNLQTALAKPAWNISNLNVEAIVVAGALLVVAIILIFYSR